MLNEGTFPRSADELSLDWFNDATEAKIGGRADAITLEPLAGAGDGFYGTHLKIKATYADARAPLALVAKLSPQNAEARAAVNRINCFEREVNFYRHFADKCPVRVPRCYFAEFDTQRGDSLLLLEYIDGLPGSHLAGASYQQAESAMRTAAKLHRFWQEYPVLDHTHIDKLTDVKFTGAMAEAARDAIPLALEKMPGIAPDRILRHGSRAAEIIVEQAHAFGQLPHTLIHFDYHVANLVYPSLESSGDPTLIDWQFFVEGPGVWDVGAFCVMSLRAEDRAAWEKELGLVYLSEIEGKSVTSWPAWFEEAYVRVAVSFAAHLFRNAPMFDFSDENVVEVAREFFKRVDRMIEEHEGQRFLEQAL